MTKHSRPVNGGGECHGVVDHDMGREQHRLLCPELSCRWYLGLRRVPDLWGFDPRAVDGADAPGLRDGTLRDHVGL